jgi:hypothetical protein
MGIMINPPSFSPSFISLCDVVQTSFHCSYVRTVSLSLSSLSNLDMVIISNKNDAFLTRIVSTLPLVIVSLIFRYTHFLLRRSF